MIVTRNETVVYDTGADHGEAGELRRVALAELVDHPQARWRPVSDNPNFLDVYGGIFCEGPYELRTSLFAVSILLLGFGIVVPAMAKDAPRSFRSRHRARSRRERVSKCSSSRGMCRRWSFVCTA